MKLFLSAGILILVMGSCTNQIAMKSMNTSTVDTLDLERYLGTWYEIARFPHSFEKDLVGVTATYSLRKDGKIKVVNQGFKGSLNGKRSKAVGKAKIPDPSQPGRLKVSFFLFFYADYNVLELDSAYQWAMIGSSSPMFFWILSRTPQMDPEVYRMLLERARERGYDLDPLIKVEQPVH
ncbi:MAG: lipocalin family protein [Bacteroidales bacterium]